MASQVRSGSKRALVAELDRRGYAPVDNGGEIRLHNCPFHHLVAEHREAETGRHLAG